jgi:hypothetical protein
MILYRICAKPRSSSKTIYQNVPHICDEIYSSIGIFPVDSHFTKAGIYVMGCFHHEAGTSSTTDMVTSLQSAFDLLDPSLKRLCGTVSFPNDNGTSLLSKINQSWNYIFGASDASIKQQRASHAWILSSGQCDDIEDPLLHIKGSGLVDGLPSLLSSSRGELAGITAITIIAQLFRAYHSSKAPVSIICDNQGMVHKCNSTYQSILMKIRKN